MGTQITNAVEQVGDRLDLAALRSFVAATSHIEPVTRVTVRISDSQRDPGYVLRVETSGGHPS